MAAITNEQRLFLNTSRACQLVDEVKVTEDAGFSREIGIELFRRLAVIWNLKAVHRDLENQEKAWDMASAKRIPSVSQPIA